MLQSEWTYWEETGEHFMAKGNCMCRGLEQKGTGGYADLRGSSRRHAVRNQENAPRTFLGQYLPSINELLV